MNEKLKHFDVIKQSNNALFTGNTVNVYNYSGLDATHQLKVSNVSNHLSSVEDGETKDSEEESGEIDAKELISAEDDDKDQEIDLDDTLWENSVVVVSDTYCDDKWDTDTSTNLAGSPQLFKQAGVFTKRLLLMPRVSRPAGLDVILCPGG
eukprot:1915802-Ditylum_brightwellii.AAC.1